MECHKETFCVAILNKQKCHFFFFYKIQGQEDRTGPAWGEGRGTSRRNGYK
jgi:hypothetical protein